MAVYAVHILGRTVADSVRNGVQVNYCESSCLMGERR